MGKNSVVTGTHTRRPLDVMYEGVLNALGIFFVVQNLHVSPGLYGILGTASGVGLALGGVLATLFAQRIGLKRSFCLALVIEGVLVLIYARLTSFAIAMLVTVLIGMSVAFIGVTSSPMILSATPKNLTGRVMSILNPSLNLSLMVSSTLAGFLDSTVLRNFHLSAFGMIIGPIDTLLTFTGVLAVVGGIWAMVNLRGIPNPAAKGNEVPPENVCENKGPSPS